MRFILFFISAFFLFTASTAVKKTNEINWISLEEADRLSKENPKKIMVFFETSWCSRCKQMDRSIFQNEGVAELLNDNFYAVRFDAESKEALTFDNIDYGYDESFGSRGAHEIATDMLEGFMAYPTVVFLDEKKFTINKLVGVQQEELFGTYLQFLTEDAYLNQDWFDYSNQQ